jgi:quercetin dioxygenase-like cupin family protein
MQQNNTAEVRPLDGRPAVSLGGLVGVIFALAGAHTGGAYAIVEHPVAPGALVPPHTHSREDEVSYVLSGEVGARIGDTVLQAGPGDYIVKPRGVPHTFWNAGPAPARLLEIISPAGLEQYFADLAALLAGGGPPDQTALARLEERYGLVYHREWIPDLVARYGLTPPGGR